MGVFCETIHNWRRDRRVSFTFFVVVVAVWDGIKNTIASIIHSRDDYQQRNALLLLSYMLSNDQDKEDVLVMANA